MYAMLYMYMYILDIIFYIYKTNYFLYIQDKLFFIYTRQIIKNIIKI